MRKRNLPLTWDTNPRQRLNASGGSQPRNDEGASRFARRGKNFEAFPIRKTVVDLYIKQAEIEERYKRKTGTSFVPERRIMAALRDMFDFQRFSGNEKLCSMIRRAEEHSGSRLSIDDLDFVNAAGTPDMLQKKNRDMQ